MAKSKLTVYVPVLYYGSNKYGCTNPTTLGAKYYGTIKDMKKHEPKMQGYIKLHTNTWPPKKRDNEKRRLTKAS